MDQEGENIYFQLAKQGGGDFPFFKAHVTFNMAMGLGTFCGVFFVMSYLWLSKGAASFLGSLMQKREEGQNWGNAAKQSMHHPDQRRESIRIAKQILIFTWKANLKNQSNIIFKWRAF